MRFAKYLSMIAMILCAGSASAQDVKVLGVHGKWTAYSFQDNGKLVCYIATNPVTSTGAYKNRGEVLAQVTHRPTDKATDVITIVAGYPYKPDSDAAVTIGGKRYDLFTVDARAWARDAKTDKDMVQAFIKANAMTVKGTSTRGTATTDTFSLQGFTAAYKAIGEACGVTSG